MPQPQPQTWLCYSRHGHRGRAPELRETVGQCHPNVQPGHLRSYVLAMTRSPSRFRQCASGNVSWSPADCAGGSRSTSSIRGAPAAGLLPLLPHGRPWCRMRHLPPATVWISRPPPLWQPGKIPLPVFWCNNDNFPKGGWPRDSAGAQECLHFVSLSQAEHRCLTLEKLA